MSAQVRAAFRGLLARGCALKPQGEAKGDPTVLLKARYQPCYALEVFGWTWLLTELLSDEGLAVFVAYVTRASLHGGKKCEIVPRLFYKDSSLMWRVASHFVHDEHEYWIGKGAVRTVQRGGEPYVHTLEETTNLPLEVQGSLDELSRRSKRRVDNSVVERVLRRAPSGRVEPYRDFTAPRAKAQASGRLHGGRAVARFGKAADPGSLVFVRGYEPDFDTGVAGVTRAASRFFGGHLEKYRVLSRNRRIQYLFMATPQYAWCNPPQTLTSELSSYGVRVDDVFVAENLCVPALEYHEVDEDGVVTHTQIPAGFAGDAHPKDPDRADATAWVEQLPVIREFRRKVLRRSR